MIRKRTTSDPTRVPALGALVFLVVAAAHSGDDALAPPAPAVALDPERVANLDQYACATCHTEVADEWARSAHGLAWDDRAYQASLESKRRPQSCHGCHIPQPLLAGELPRRPKPRDENKHLGVSCEACHLGPNGEMLGPRGTPVDAHASSVSERMSAPGSDGLCLACHSTNIGPVIGIGKDFTAADLSAQDRSCVGCHMAPIERRWADGENVPARTGRSHALQTPRDPTFLRRAIEVSWRTDGGRNRVVITNKAGHRVPGLIGRELRFRAELLDPGNVVVETSEVTIDTRAYLPVNGTIDIAFTKTGASVRVSADHIDPRSEEPIRFLDEALRASD